MIRTAEGSALLITLDSCRYDTFAAVRPAHLGAIGRLYRAHSPSYFTFGSHAAMFVGFTPGVAGAREPVVDPKYGKFFKLRGAPGLADPRRHHVLLEGRNLADGFNRKGFATVGTGAVGWFDPATPTGRVLAADFDRFFYPGDTWSIRRQVAWLLAVIVDSAPRPVFAFLNAGETHVPYYYEGADWDPATNPCLPDAATNDAAECRRRQALCLAHVDRALEPLLAAFEGRSVLACGDHGDCWGEDGLWEHGTWHPKVFEVPLVYRLAAERPVN